MSKTVRFGSVMSYILLLFVMLSGCLPSRQAGVPSPTKTEGVIEVFQSSSKIISQSFEELALNSDLVVIGSIVEEKQIINTARDPNDPTKPDPEYYSVGQTYSLRVEKYIKGEGPEVIRLIQNQGFIVMKDSQQPGSEEIQAAKKVEYFVPLVFDKPYLLFLRALTGYYEGYQKIGLYTGTAEPWIYDFTNPDCVRIEGPDQSLARYFPPQPSSIIVEKITSAQDGKITGETLTYPAPYGANQSLCQTDALQPYPYPPHP